MAVWLGIDVGGTFTDLAAVDSRTGQGNVVKVATSLPDQSEGILEAIKASGVDLSEVEVIVHGTTTATNAVIEGEGARTGLITTRGFRDVLELGRRTRPHLYGLGGSFSPLVPRALRLEVEERITATGEIATPLDEDQVRAAADQLREAGCAAVAVCFLNSYINRAHELRAAEVVREQWPNAHVTESSAILPQIREFERTTTAVLNATLQPLITKYLDRLLLRLADRGYAGSMYVVQANGGVMLAEITGGRAVHTVASGPAAGVTAAAQIGADAGFPNVISGDMGGTSFDVATIHDSRPQITEDRQLGFRIPLCVPCVDIVTIGAGGGSLARVDNAGLLHVGPESAGSYPGPVCYRRGGTRPTLTDANLWLGRLDTEQIASLSGSADIIAVEAALRDHVAEPLGLSVDEAATAVVRVANSTMASAIRVTSIERGVDPRDFALVTFGGAGPLHAMGLAEEIGIGKVLVPPRPGVTSALGCLVANVRIDRRRSVAGAAAELDVPTVRAELVQLDHEVREELRGTLQGVASVSYTLQMRYLGQFHAITVSLTSLPEVPEQLISAFEREYRRLYGGVLPRERGIRIHAVGVTLTCPRVDVDLAVLKSRDTDDSSRHRRAWFAGSWSEVPVIRRGALREGEPRSGPMIIEQEDSTIAVEPGWVVKANAQGTLVCRKESE